MMGSPESEGRRAGGEAAAPGANHQALLSGKVPGDAGAVGGRNGQQSQRLQVAENPVENVSWHDCQEFVKKLNAKVRGRKFQLPTEAQWEYACRAGTKTRYCFGDDESKLRRLRLGRQEGQRNRVARGRQEAQRLGTLRHAGERQPVVPDYYDERYYGKSPTDDPPGAVQGIYPRCIRGGSRLSYTSQCRSASRRGMMEVGKNRTVGLRVARVVKEK